MLKTFFGAARKGKCPLQGQWLGFESGHASQPPGRT